MAAFILEAVCTPAGESAVTMSIVNKDGARVIVLLSTDETMTLAANLVEIVDQIKAADEARKASPVQ